MLCTGLLGCGSSPQGSAQSTPDVADTDTQQGFQEQTISLVGFSELSVGEANQIFVYLESASYETVPNEDLRWWSSDPEIATVNDNGVVRAVAPGRTTINVELVEMGLNASTEITVSEPSFKFVQATEKNFDYESPDGYSYRMTVTSWYGTMGTGDVLAHPADSTINILETDKQTLIVPFVVDVKNTTADTSFKKDLNFRCSNRNPSSDLVYLCVNGSWTEVKANGLSRQISDSTGGQWMRFCGYFCVYNAVSPNFPVPALDNAPNLKADNILFSFPGGTQMFSLYEDERGIYLHEGRWNKNSSGNYSGFAENIRVV